MSLHCTVKPDYYPLTLEEAKLQGRVDGTDEDTLILDYVIAATRMIENESNRQLLTATYTYSVGLNDEYLQANDFNLFYPIPTLYPIVTLTNLTRPYLRIELPKSPLQEVISVQYYDSTNTLLTLDVSKWRTQNDDNLPGAVIITDVPAIQQREDAIKITFKCGYGNAEDIPETYRVAIRQLVADWFRNRESSSSIQMYEIPYGVDRLIRSESMHFYR